MFGHHKDGLAIREHPFGKGFRNRWRLSESRTCSLVNIIAHPKLVRWAAGSPMAPCHQFDVLRTS